MDMATYPPQIIKRRVIQKFPQPKIPCISDPRKLDECACSSRFPHIRIPPLCQPSHVKHKYVKYLYTTDIVEMNGNLLLKKFKDTEIAQD